MSNHSEENLDSPAQRAAEPICYTRHDHGVPRALIDEDARAIIARLQRHGFAAYVVGGGVRDLLLNKKPKDFDIATEAKPNDIKKLFRNSRIIGRRFRLAHVFFGQRKVIEVATFRDIAALEEEEPALEDQNVYGTERSDAFRRDLTINGLFYDPMTETIIDYVGGMQDLRDSVIRVIGDPVVRFQEDPVRMLRVIRHAARSGFRIEAKCWKSIQHDGELLLSASRARLYEEFKKDLSSGAFAPVLRLLYSSGLLARLIPGLLSIDGAPESLPVRHPLVHALSIIDELVNTGEPLSLTPVLALLTLYRHTQNFESENLILELRTKEQVIDEMGDAFGALQVPRRERDAVAELVSILRRLLENSGLVQRLRTREVFRELRFFLISLNDIAIYSQLLSTIDEAGPIPHGGSRSGSQPRNDRPRRRSSSGRHSH